MMYLGSKKLRIILGEDCNMNCLYCGQHANTNKTKPLEISKNFLDYLNYLNNILHISNEKISLQFFGGEPLLYFNKVIEIVNYVKSLKYDTFTFSITTNGKLLSKEIIDYLNENNFIVCISWDGYNTIKTRGFDPFEYHKDIIFDIKKIGLSGVVTKYNYKPDIIEAHQHIDSIYFNKTSHHIQFSNIIYMCDLNYDNFGLNDFDIDTFNNKYSKLFEIYRKYMLITDKNKKLDFYNKNNIAIGYVINYINTINEELDNKYEKNSLCNIIIDALPIDLEGNVYSCSQIMDKPIFNIITDNNKDILNKYAQSEFYIMNRRKTMCKDCYAHSLCRGACKLIKNENMESTCKLEKMRFDIIYNEIIETQKLLEE